MVRMMLDMKMIMLEGILVVLVKKPYNDGEDDDVKNNGDDGQMTKNHLRGSSVA